MKVMKKLLVGLLTLTLLLSFTISALAAIEVKPGKSVTVSFTIKGVYGADGWFEYSNQDLFKSLTYKSDTKLAGDISNNRIYFYGSNESDITIYVNATIASNAKAGEKCEIKLTYETADANGNMSDWKTISKTVEVKEATVQPTEPTTKPTVKPVDKKVDYTRLKELIAQAESLDKYAYTLDSWTRLETALDAGKALLKSKSQSAVDQGVSDLEVAIAGLVAMNFAPLDAAIANGKSISDKCAHSELWYELFDLLGQEDEIRKCQDQAKVDEYVAKLNGVIDRIAKDCPNCGEVVTVTVVTEVTKVVEKEVTVTVPVTPDGDYCNIGSHTLYKILFFVCLGLLLVLVALFVWLLLNKKKNQKDDTPVVDYDIADDDKSGK